MTREEWLTRAVETIDAEIFEGDLDTINHKFQINCGICPGKRLTNTIQPYDVEDVKLDDFFPTTISVNHTIKDPIDILANLTRECIFAFFNEKKLNKRTKSLMDKYYFDKPYTECCPSDYLITLLKEVYAILVKKYGDYPGQPVVIYPKEKKEGKKNVVVMFCPECGYEIKVSRKMHEKHNFATPTCACGTKMCTDEEESINEEES
jgi:hypothetical protein